MLQFNLSDMLACSIAGKSFCDDFVVYVEDIQDAYHSAVYSSVHSSYFDNSSLALTVQQFPFVKADSVRN